MRTRAKQVQQWWQKVRRSPIWLKLTIRSVRLHRRLRPYYPHMAAFAAGITAGWLLWGGNGGTSSETESAAASDVPLQAAAPDAVDWSPLLDNMCRPDSEINRFAMKFDFPFESCQQDNGQIEASCVQKDAERFQPTLPVPYQAALGKLEVKLESGEGWTDMHYFLPLDKAAYHGMPLTALAVRIETDSGNELQGWQTPYLVIADDFSKIRTALSRYSPSAQPVYYADIPPEKDILSGPFGTEEQARAVSKKAGGNPDKITRQMMKPEAAFNDKLNAVTLGCVSQAVVK